jgi:chorismate synthase
MGSTYGKIFKIATFGESHGAGIGVIIDGCPAGIDFDTDFIQSELTRRKPGQSRITTQRREADEFEVLSGVFEGKTTGTPIALIIRNEDQRSKDYSHIAAQFRPSHADYTYQAKYGGTGCSRSACQIAFGKTGGEYTSLCFTGGRNETLEAVQ